MPELKRLLEAFIFAAEAPLSLDRLATLLECSRPEVKERIEQLQAEYAERRCGFQLAEVAGGYQFRTASELAPQLRKLNRERPLRFSRAAMETLAITAYRQPLTRAEIEYLRGVDSGGVIKTLLDRNLLRILGKKDIPGRPLIYGTSRYFLELFSLRSLNDLPTLKEFAALEPQVDQAEPVAAEDFEE